MQANELRIGNLITHVNPNPKKEKPLGLVGPFRVDEIRKNSVSVTDVHDLLPFAFDAKEIEGIPLTPELLEKCGFERVAKELGGMRFELSKYFKLEFWEIPGMRIVFDGNFEVREYHDGNKIQFLHQLQNLYFALTGEELNIQL